MKKLTALLVALIISAAVRAYAEDYQPSGKISVIIWNQYLGGTAAVARKAPVLQTDLYLQLPHGFYLEPWISTDFNRNFANDFGKEIDWNVGWAGKIDGFGLDLGASYFDLVRLFSANGPIGDIIELHGEVNRSFRLIAFDRAHTITPYLRFEGKLPIREEVDKGLYAHVGLRHSWQIFSSLRLDHSVETFYDTGAFRFRPALIGVYQVGLNWKLTKSISIGPQVKFSMPLAFQGMPDRRRGEAAFGGGITFEF